MAHSEDNNETKRYTLTNEQPGPRGLNTAAAGVVMVQPSLAGAVNGVTAELTADEVKMAKAAGLKVDKGDTADGEITGNQSENLPAEGQIDPNAPDAAKLMQPEQPKQGKQSKQGEQPEQGEQK